jgi:outer membrane PBP1 activator LpoA protein
VVSSTPGRVALLLPLTGPASTQAATVRDGFLSALYQVPAATRPDLQMFDTGAVTATDAIAQARAGRQRLHRRAADARGCRRGRGPGIRIRAGAGAELPASRSPRPGGMYQFALSPEEEAQQVARRMLADGHRRGVALVPRGDWGNRVIEAFTRELTAGGGSLISQTLYDPAEHDYSYELKPLLRIDDSEARHAAPAECARHQAQFRTQAPRRHRVRVCRAGERDQRTADRAAAEILLRRRHPELLAVHCL